MSECSVLAEWKCSLSHVTVSLCAHFIAPCYCTPFWSLKLSTQSPILFAVLMSAALALCLLAERCTLGLIGINASLVTNFKVLGNYFRIQDGKEGMARNIRLKCCTIILHITLNFHYNTTCIIYILLTLKNKQLKK